VQTQECLLPAAEHAVEDSVAPGVDLEEALVRRLGTVENRAVAVGRDHR